MSGDYQRAKELYLSRRFDEFIQSYEKLVQNQKKRQQVSTNVQKLKKLYNKSKELIAKIDDLTQKLHNKMENWQINHLDSQGAYIAIRKQPNSIEARYQITLKSGLLHLCQLFSHTPSYKDMLPFCQDSHQVSSGQHILEKDAIIKFKIPFLDNRNLVLKVRGIDRLASNHSIVIYGEGYEKEIAEKMVKGLKGEYLKLKHFLCEIKIKPDSYTIASYAFMDSTISFMPDWIINRLVKLIGSFLVNKFVHKVINGPSSIQQEKLITNPKFNACLSERLSIYHSILPKL